MQNPTKITTPASIQQQGIWFHALSGAASYWNVVDFRLFKGQLDEWVVRQAWDRVIQKHSALRTNFIFQEDSLFQVISEEYQLDKIIQVEYPKIQSEAEIQPYLNSKITHEKNHVFDLESDSLFTCQLINFPSHVCILISIHHIIHDVASLQILWQELSANYNSILESGQVHNSHTLKQYYQYSQRQKAYLESEIYQAQKHAETLKLSQGIPDLNLAFYADREKATLFQQERRFPEQLVQDIKSFSLRNRVLFSSVFQLAFFILLQEYATNHFFLIANTVSGRGRGKLNEQGTIGLFANRLIHALQIKKDSRLRDLLQTVSDDISTALRNNVPFEDLMRDSHFSKKHGLTQIQAGFNMIKLLADRPQFRGLEEETHIEIEHPGRPNIPYDVFLAVIEKPGEFTIRLDLLSDPEFHPLLDLMLDKYIEILKYCLHKPDASIKELNLLTEKETQLLERFNDTQVDFPEDLTLLEFFEEHTKKFGHQVALISRNTKFTYGELDRKSNRLARYLQDFGIGEESIVGICLDRTPEMLIGILGVIKAGGAFLPMDPSYPIEWKEYVLLDANISCILSKSTIDLPQNLSKTPKIFLDLDQSIIDQESSLQLETKPNSKALAYVIYTSGSTGKPKGVMIEHKALLNFLLSMKELLQPEIGSRMLSATTFSFDIFYLELFLPLISGGQVILASTEESKDGHLLHELISRHKPDFIQSTPSGWQMILDSSPNMLTDIQILSGGEPILASLKDILFRRGAAKVWNLFGPTETTIWSTAQELKPSENISIGKPIANTKIQILDGAGNMLPLGKKGYLYIGGKGLAREYLNRNDLTREKFVFPSLAPDERFYFTGDIARWLPTGKLEFWGREDEQVKIRGHRVELGEIEHVLSTHDSIKSCSVLVRKDENHAQRLIAYVIPRGTLDVKRVQAYLNQKLPAYMVPAVWIEMKNFPLTLNGKVDKKSLPNPNFNEMSNAHLHPPITNTEHKIAAIWENLLNLNQIGIYDNFFELGGHSLIATRVLASIRKEFSISIPLKVFFDLKEIHGIAQYIDLIEKVNYQGEYEVIDI